jgi:hypothetical protein
MNDANADKQLAFLMAQFSDLRVKLSAIRTYNDLNGRIKTKIELDFSNKTDAELDAEIAEITLQISEAEAVVNGEQESPQGNLYVVPRSIAEVNDGTEA